MVAYTYTDKEQVEEISVKATSWDDAIEQLTELLDRAPLRGNIIKHGKVAARLMTKAKKPAAKGHCDIQPSGYRILPCRAGTKQAMLLDMLASTGGATMEELTEALGWKAVTVRSGFSWDMKNKGYGVKSEEIGDKIVYKIVVPEGEEIPPHTPRKSAK